MIHLKAKKNFKQNTVSGKKCQAICPKSEYRYTVGCKGEDESKASSLPYDLRRNHQAIQHCSCLGGSGEHRGDYCIRNRIFILFRTSFLSKVFSLKKIVLVSTDDDFASAAATGHRLKGKPRSERRDSILSRSIP